MSRPTVTVTDPGEALYMRVLPAPFSLEESSLSDLWAAMAWCKQEIKVWKKLLKAELAEGAPDNDIEGTKDELEKTEQLYDAIDEEISKRLKPTLDSFYPLGL